MSHSRPPKNNPKKQQPNKWCCNKKAPSTYAMKTKFNYALGGCGEVKKQQADVNREANLNILGGIAGLMAGITTTLYYLNSCDHTSTGGAYPSTAFCYTMSSFLFLRAYTLQKKAREAALKLIDKLNDQQASQQPLLTRKPSERKTSQEFKQIEGVPTIVSDLPQQTSDENGIATSPGYRLLQIKSPRS